MTVAGVADGRRRLRQQQGTGPLITGPLGFFCLAPNATRVGRPRLAQPTGQGAAKLTRAAPAWADDDDKSHPQTRDLCDFINRLAQAFPADKLIFTPFPPPARPPAPMAAPMRLQWPPPLVWPDIDLLCVPPLLASARAKACAAALV